MLDLNKHYMVPMSRVDSAETDEAYIECEIIQNNNYIIVKALNDGYRIKRFYPEYFEILIISGYIK